MTAAAAPTFGPGSPSARAMNRAFVWSLAAHVAIVAFFVLVPREWLARAKPAEMMTITLSGGAVGPQTSGMTSIGGRTIEQVAPEPKRPETIRPTPDADPSPFVTKPREGAPVTQAPPPLPVTRAPTTGPQMVQGNTSVETGARGMGEGLTVAGGLAVGDSQLKSMEFCCPQYVALLKQRVDANWQRFQAERGTAQIGFKILRDGRVTSITLEESSGSTVLDRVSRNAVNNLSLPPLPEAYTFESLTIHLKFPYEGR